MISNVTLQAFFTEVLESYWITRLLESKTVIVVVLHDSDKAVKRFVIDDLFDPVGLKKRNDLIFGVVGVHAVVMEEVLCRVNVGTLVDIIQILCVFACALIKIVYIS